MHKICLYNKKYRLQHHPNRLCSINYEVSLLFSSFLLHFHPTVFGYVFCNNGCRDTYMSRTNVILDFWIYLATIICMEYD